MWQKFMVICILMPPFVVAHAGLQSKGSEPKIGGIVPKNSAEQFELAFWKTISGSSQVSDYEAYLTAYPKGRFVALAKARIAGLRSASRKAVPIASPAQALPPARPPRTKARTAVRPKKTAAKVASAAPVEELPAVSGGATAVVESKDCAECPTLIALSRGAFTMGGSIDQTEQPAHLVTVDHPFAIGRYEVTVREWEACVKAGACPRVAQYASPNPRAPTRDVSWDDAQQYVKWLSTVSGKPYRLPSEAEWEYAARGGTSTRYWWGDKMETGKANCQGCGPPWRIDEPPEVGSFAPNTYGLHDMNGSVWEWVQDCWHNSYSQSPGDAVAWEDQPTCSARVIRGGSWRDSASYVESSTRSSDDAGARHSQNGFRVARDID